MTKLEEVARAIYAKRNGPGAKPWSLLTKAHRTPYLDDARNAIQAMRRPNLAMLEAMGQAAYFDESEWFAGIDAILSEGEK